MESPPDAGWCDFCKEPFRDRKPEPAALPSSGEKLSEEELLKRLPAEYLRGSDGERLPTVPRWAKNASWAFLAAMVVLAVAATLTFVSRARTQSQMSKHPEGRVYDSGVIEVRQR